MDEPKSDIRYCDVIVSICFIFLLITHFITVFYINKTHKETKANIEAIATVYESNPIASMLFNLNKIGTITANLIIPASIMALYLFFRRKVLNGKMEAISLIYFVNFSLFSFLLNIVNDVAFILAKLI